MNSQLKIQANQFNSQQPTSKENTSFEEFFPSKNNPEKNKDGEKTNENAIDSLYKKLNLKDLDIIENENLFIIDYNNKEGFLKNYI